jgi:hypothetical protein
VNWQTIENGCIDGKDGCAAKDDETTEAKRASRNLRSPSAHASHPTTLLHHPPKTLRGQWALKKRGILVHGITACHDGRLSEQRLFTRQRGLFQSETASLNGVVSVCGDLDGLTTGYSLPKKPLVGKIESVDGDLVGTRNFEVDKTSIEFPHLS